MADQALTDALAALDRAANTMTAPIFEEHAAAVPAAVEALTRFYLLIDPKTGTVELGPTSQPRPIYTDPERVVFGLIPRAVQPLVTLLRAQTDQLDRLEDWPASERSAIDRWKQRLLHYEQVLSEEMASAPDKPSDRLWREVTDPLLRGKYPPTFAAMGIVNPLVRSKPDVTTPATELYITALDEALVTDTQKWLLDAQTAISEWRRAMVDAVTRALDKPLATARRWAWYAGGGLLIIIIFFWLRSRRPQLVLR